MSFSHDVKAELCRQPFGGACCAVAECYGVLLYCNTFSQREARIVTESGDFAARLPKLFRRAFGVTFDAQKSYASGKQTFTVNAREKLRALFDAYGFELGFVLAHHINLGVLEEDCCRQSFLRGAFLAGGSVTDPAKRYHLELVTDHYSVNRELFSLLLELDFAPKDTARGGNYITYFKQSGAIEDFLTFIGAPVGAMTHMSAKIEKDMRNSVNRRVNCDTANVSKTVDAAQAQIDAIQKLGADVAGLPEKLRRTAVLRLENPELSLTELTELFSPPVTKSCLNHRLRKLVELADADAT
ncbi:MAG: DNA-binding protein WhiA [Oscillospiraceae bacterium]|nr:DNA-binding protein WhiA [Oscillospiraceae bacterium]